MSRNSLPLSVITLSLTPTLISAFALHLPRGIDIDNSPAPSPEDGPPLSANASRDPALIPYQVVGIVGSYLLTLLIIGSALWFFGRRLRKEALQSKRQDVELSQSAISTKQYYSTPVSPGNPHTPNFSWPSPTADKKSPNPYVYPTGSPQSVRGNESFDHRVLEADRDLLARNLEDLYAHVMEHEEAKAAGITLKDPVPPRPIKPAAPAPAENPQRGTMAKGRRPSGLEMVEGKLEKSHSRASSLIQSLKSPKSPKRKGIRSLRISSPIPTPLSAAFSPASDEEPLSPRYYSPPSPPPIPGQSSRNHSRQNSTDPSPVSPVRSMTDQFSNTNLDRSSRERPYGHRYNQPSYSSQRSGRDPIADAPVNSQKTLYPRSQPKIQIQVPTSRDSQLSPALSTHQSSYSASRPLPFRAYEPSIQSTVSQNTKTTVLERTTPLSPGLRTPFTAGAVPYSPYQPFTPVVPITPRLVTRQEMKIKKKEENKKPALEMIKSDDELWDSGW